MLSGSDSGHIFIWDAARSGHLPSLSHGAHERTSRLVNLLKADRRTVNGVIAHPSLPMFASYGIDCDAKLWAFASRDYLEDGDEDDEGRVDEAYVPGNSFTTGTEETNTPVVSTGTICSRYCDLVSAWGRLDAKRDPLVGTEPLFHHTSIIRPNSEQHNQPMRDNRVFDKESFKHSVHGILRDMASRGVIVLIKHRYPGKDPLPGHVSADGVGAQYDLKITTTIACISYPRETRSSMLRLNTSACEPIPVPPHRKLIP